MMEFITNEFLFGYIKYDIYNQTYIHILGIIENLGICIKINKSDNGIIRGIEEIMPAQIIKMINNLETLKYKQLTSTQIKLIMKDLNRTFNCCMGFFNGNLTKEITFNYNKVWKVSKITEKIIKKEKIKINECIKYVNTNIQTIIWLYIGNPIYLIT